jgi:hypothetical protein
MTDETKTSTDSISNWTFFGVHLAAIELSKHYCQETGEVFYNASIGFSLDDGQTEEFEKFITINTDLIDSDPISCAINAELSICDLFTYSKYVIIVDSLTGEEIGEFYLPEDINMDFNSNEIIVSWFKTSEVEYVSNTEKHISVEF